MSVKEDRDHPRIDEEIVEVRDIETEFNGCEYRYSWTLNECDGDAVCEIDVAWNGSISTVKCCPDHAPEDY